MKYVVRRKLKNGQGGWKYYRRGRYEEENRKLAQQFSEKKARATVAHREGSEQYVYAAVPLEGIDWKRLSASMK